LNDIFDHTTLVASNTSSIPITHLKNVSKFDLIGVHFFSPAELMELVEVIVTKNTQSETLAKVLDLVALLKKLPIVVNDSRGFYTTRVVNRYCAEGMLMLVEGVNPSLIEQSARLCGMPVAPLALCDEVGLDIAYHIMQQTIAADGEKSIDKRLSGLLSDLVNTHKRLGKKNEKGFYDHLPSGKVLWPEWSNIFPQSKKQPTTEQIQDRLLLVQCVEVQKCIAEGVITDPREADVGAIFGWGFAPWTGGPVSYLNYLGARQAQEKLASLVKNHGNRFSFDKVEKAGIQES
jgi:3-hydroxyacyl-CoA dehydrogenase